MSIEDKKLRFALFACGVDPETVTITSPLHDVQDIECNPGDEHAVCSALKIWLKAHLEETYPMIENYRELLKKLPP